MKHDFLLLTTFLLQTQDNKTSINIQCLGSQEILALDRETPGYILGMIEFESSYIPVVDLGAAFGIEPIKIDNSKCILIVEHNYQSLKHHTGIIIKDFEEIMKLAAGTIKLGTGLGTSANMHFILEMQNNYNDGHEILVESHKMLPLFCGSYDFINTLEAMDFNERQVMLEEFENKSWLWDQKNKVMYL